VVTAARDSGATPASADASGADLLAARRGWSAQSAAGSTPRPT
jgi:hypothetical protein